MLETLRIRRFLTFGTRDHSSLSASTFSQRVGTLLILGTRVPTSSRGIGYPRYGPTFPVGFASPVLSLLLVSFISHDIPRDIISWMVLKMDRLLRCPSELNARI